MSDLTRYWHDESIHLEPCECMVPDSTLQDIADAWEQWKVWFNEGFRPDADASIPPTPHVFALLDGLVNDE